MRTHPPTLIYALKRPFMFKRVILRKLHFFHFECNIDAHTSIYTIGTIKLWTECRLCSSFNVTNDFVFAIVATDIFVKMFRSLL